MNRWKLTSKRYNKMASLYLNLPERFQSSDRVTISADSKKIVIQHAILGDERKTYSLIKKSCKNTYQLGLVDFEVPDGTYPADLEETTEDTAVFYLEDRL